jgi:hypothetical protein
MTSSPASRQGRAGRSYRTGLGEQDWGTSKRDWVPDREAIPAPPGWLPERLMKACGQAG